MIIKSDTTNCGCGGHCACSGNCSCQPGSCDATCSPGITRPNFFAGQLLTDDDLQATLNYVVQKNRLHNKHFLGDGVVCGLQVVPHPCAEDQHKIVVQSGHAIDCCGNDIVVPCDVELNINKRVRELTRVLHGEFDCQDPCRDPAARLNSSGEDQDQPNGENGPFSDIDEYCLYLRYDEVHADLIAPYDTGDECAVSCHPSRIRESYCFDLRCPQKAKPFVDMRARLEECKKAVAGYQKLNGDAIHALRTMETAEKVLVQFDSIANGLADGPARESLVAALKQAVQDLATSIGELPAGEEQPVPIALQRKIVGHTSRFLSFAFRGMYDKAQIGEQTKEIATATQQKIAADDHRILKRLFKVAKNESSLLPVPSSAVKLLIARNELLKAALVEGEKASSFDAQSRIVGELIGANTIARVVKRAAEITKQLLKNAKQAEVSIDPNLEASLKSLHLDAIAENKIELYLSHLNKIRDLKQKLAIVGRAVSEISKRCLCDIILPPCPTCDEDAVLIACIKVQDCKVIDVCNLVRKFVLTGPSLRYWFSDFSAILDPIRNACCPTEDLIRSAKNEARQRQQALEELWRESGSVTEPPFVPDIRDVDDNLGRWKDLGADIKATEKHVDYAAVEPPEARLFELIDEGKPGVFREISAESLGKGLAALAGRPPADIRDMLDVSEQRKSPAQVERTALAAIQALKEDFLADVKEPIGNAVEKVIGEKLEAEKTLRLEGDKKVKQEVTETIDEKIEAENQNRRDADKKLRDRIKALEDLHEEEGHEDLDDHGEEGGAEGEEEVENGEDEAEED